jgi:murein DD-endopeptidase MepM/ murein hydrolase activator NlpD
MRILFLATAIIVASIVALALFWHRLYTPSLTVVPSTQIAQGDPIMIKVEGVSGTSSIKTALFNGVPISLFLYRGTPTGLIAIALGKKPATYPLSVTLSNGTVLTKEITVTKRNQPTGPLGIPAQLGGNTPESQQALIASLAFENQSLLHIPTAPEALWTQAFLWPLTHITVTNPYGYIRETGAYTIAHQGVDFEATPGTPVMAINQGVVRLATYYRDYGNTVVVDHGVGLMSFYMHLSNIAVKVGQKVSAGQVIGESGETGYSEGPHLHLTIRITNSSIDPMAFFALFK